MYDVHRFADVWIQRVQCVVMVEVCACHVAYGMFVCEISDHYTFSVFGDVNCWCNLPCYALVYGPVSNLYV